MERQLAARQRQRLVRQLRCIEEVTVKSAAALARGSMLQVDTVCGALEAYIKELDRVLAVWNTQAHALSSHASLLRHHCAVTRSLAASATHCIRSGHALALSPGHVLTTPAALPAATLISTVALAHLLLQPTPPEVQVEDTAALLSCATAALGPDGSIPLTSLLQLAATAAHSAALVTPWCEVIPHAKLGSVVSARDLAKAAGVDNKTVAQSLAAQRARQISSVARRLRLPAAWRSKAEQWIAGPVDLSTVACDAGSCPSLDAAEAVLSSATDPLTAAAMRLGLAAAAQSVSKVRSNIEDATRGQAALSMEAIPTAAATTAQAVQAAVQARSLFLRVLATLSSGLDSVWRAMVAHNMPSPAQGFDYMRTELLINTGAKELRLDAGPADVELCGMAFPCGTATRPPKLAVADALYIPAASAARIGTGAVDDPAAPLPTASLPAEQMTVTVLEDQAGTYDQAASTPARRRHLSRLAASLGCSTEGDGAHALQPLQADGSVHGIPVSPKGVVILCQPNAGVFECAYRHMDLLPLYGSLGLDCLLFNYRGYSKLARGVPTPSRLQADGEALARWLRETVGVQRIIAHGESLGGLVASHLCASGLVDVAVFDRTMDSLPAVASTMLGDWAKHALTWLTGWSWSNADAVWRSTAIPRIVAVDVNDEVINYRASLSAALCTRAVQQLAGGEGARQLDSLAWHLHGMMMHLAESSAALLMTTPTEALLLTAAATAATAAAERAPAQAAGHAAAAVHAGTLPRFPAHYFAAANHEKLRDFCVAHHIEVAEASPAFQPAVLAAADLLSPVQAELLPFLAAVADSLCNTSLRQHRQSASLTSTDAAEAQRQEDALFASAHTRMGDTVLLFILSSLSNGTGQHLGQAMAGGIEDVRHFLATGIMCGWPGQCGLGALAAMQEGAPAAQEDGCAMALRRVRAHLTAVRGYADIPAPSLVSAPLVSVSRVEEVEAVLGSVQRLQAHAAEVVTLPLQQALRAPSGIILPVTCGHNAPWQPSEKELLRKLVAAALE